MPLEVTSERRQQLLPIAGPILAMARWTLAIAFAGSMAASEKGVLAVGDRSWPTRATVERYRRCVDHRPVATQNRHSLRARSCNEGHPLS